MHIPIEDEFGNELDGKVEIIIEDSEFSNKDSEENFKLEEKKEKQSKKSDIKNKEYSKEEKGTSSKIIVYARLGNATGTLLSAVKINLYMLNGISPRLIESKLTNEDGKVVFDNLSNGSFRVIALLDKKYFEKPTYLQWNEVTINSNTQVETITVVNKVRIPSS